VVKGTEDHFTASEIIQNHRFTQFYGECIKIAARMVDNTCGQVMHIRKLLSNPIILGGHGPCVASGPN